MKIVNYIILLLLLLVAEFSNAQQLRFDRFDLSNGLSQNNINCLEFDQMGNVWIGTLDGVNRYNGYQFDIFKPNRSRENQLIGNHVISMGQGFKGDMWLITRGGGLNYFKAANQSFQLINPDVFGQFNLEQTSTIVQTSDSLLWLCNRSIVGVWSVNQSGFATCQATDEIRGMRRWTNNSVLVYGSFGIEEFTYDAGTKEFQSTFLSTRPCFALTVNDNRLIGIFQDGIYSIEKGIAMPIKLLGFYATDFEKYNKSGINDFAFTNEGCWIGGTGFFVRFYKENGRYRFQHFENDPLNDYSFKGNTVTRIQVDELGNIWIGTAKNGLLHLNHQKNQFQHYSWKIEAMTDPESNPVRAICRTKNLDLWLGFDQEGIALMQTNTSLNYYQFYFNKNNEKRLITNVRVIFEDSQGNIWVGVNDNLCIYNQKADRFESADCKYPWAWPYRCYVIKEFEPGTVTLTSSTLIGMVNLNDQSITTIPLSLKGAGGFQSVRDIVQDKYRNLWLAQDNVGLQKIAYPNLEYSFIQSATEGLSDNKVYCLLETGDSLWIGTNGGLSLIDLRTNKIVQNYFEEDGLSNNIVYSITKDGNGLLWMSTNRGITCFDTGESVFKSFLPNDYFMDDAHFVDKSGVIYYGGYTGVVSFLPSDIETASPMVYPFLESFSMFNQPVYPGDTLNGKVLLSQALAQLQALDLSYKQHTISIGFNAYPFDYPNLHEFRYRLKNYQQEWTEDNGSRLATYTKLPPGNYVFQLQVASFHNQYGNTVELNLNVIPPFWQTTGFRILMIVGFILIIAGLFQIRIKQIQQRNKWLQQKVEEQTRELREQNRKILDISEKLHDADESKLRFFTNISHEFRTPLTLILGHLENISTDSKQAVRSIRKNALRLLTLINQLIDLRKMDQDQLDLSVSSFELNSMVKEVMESFTALTDQQQMELIFKSNVDELWVWLDVDKTEKILYNLLSNALKYSPKGKSVRVEVESCGDKFQVLVKDQGIGIAESELKTIFERFYRTGNSQVMAGGHGIGLSMVKGLIAIQQGEIQVTSRPGEGSCFCLTFRMGNDHFKPTDFGEAFPAVLTLSTDDLNAIQGNEQLGRPKILVVEDHQELAQFIENTLTPQFEVRKAENGKMALGLLQNYIPDLILSDLMMPLMDGIEFCKVVKNSIETSHIPFILLSAKTDIETQVSGFETGADDYIEKPFLPKLLVAKIQSLLVNRENLRAQFRKMPQTGELKNQLSSRDKEFLQKVNELIEMHLGNPSFSIELLSEKVNMSRATFYRKFSDLTGVKPADYIRRFRLNAAYNFFLNTGKTTPEVAELVGFQSVSHFRKSFKDEFGVKPADVQKV